MDSTPTVSLEGLNSTKSSRTKSALHLAKSSPQTLPSTYITNTPKESLSHQYITLFRNNFTKLFPTRTPLYLTAPNEFKVTKFVCNTLRPTQLQFRELYDVQKCADFVANYLDYEPLENPLTPPAR